MSKQMQADAKRIRRHLVALTETIGVRYSGTEGEQRAADYVEEQFNGLGLVNVRQEPFEFPNWDYSEGELRVAMPGETRPIPNAMPKTFTISTPPAGVEGEIVYLGTATDLDFKQHGGKLDRKIGLIVGALDLDGNAAQEHIRRSGMVGLLVVDSRVPYDWRISMGGSAQSACGHALPMMGLPFLEADRIVREMMAKPLRAKFTIRARAFPAMSQNVIGEIEGAERADQVIVVSAHHDSVMHVVGANDNASGVAFTLEMARLLTSRRPGRTIRFVSYGVEEKLSVGAYLYTRSLSKAERDRIVMGVNADSIGGAAGNDVVYLTGPSRLQRLVERSWEADCHPARITPFVSPYSDHFPLNIYGVSTLFLTRPDILGSSYRTLHSIHDNLDNVNPAVIARTTTTATEFVRYMADSYRLLFPRKLDSAVQQEVNRLARDHMCHPWSPKDFDYDHYA